MYKITLAPQSEAIVTLEGNNIVIELPDSCARDLWKAQISYWLENENEKLLETGNFRITNNNKLSKDKYSN